MKHLKFVLSGVVTSVLLAGCQAAVSPPKNAPTPTPIPQNASVSGTIKINGAVVQNSSVLMLQRKAGEAAYSEFDRLPAVDGTTWAFTKAIAGQKYDFTAAGQVDEENQVTSNAVTVTAPAEGIILTLDSKLSLPAPDGQPSVVCGDPDGTNHYNAKVSYPPIKNAKQYYATVGTSSGEDDVAAKLLPAKANEPAEMTVYIAQNSDYFTRYAYTYCTDCNQEDAQNWSGFSPTLGFKCP